MYVLLCRLMIIKIRIIMANIFLVHSYNNTFIIMCNIKVRL
jgi:hypothetical protein